MAQHSCSSSRPSLEPSQQSKVSTGSYLLQREGRGIGEITVLAGLFSVRQIAKHLSRGNDNDLLVSFALPTSEPESSLPDPASSIKADFRFKNSHSRLCDGGSNL